MLEQEG